MFDEIKKNQIYWIKLAADFYWQPSYVLSERFSFTFYKLQLPSLTPTLYLTKFSPIPSPKLATSQKRLFLIWQDGKLTKCNGAWKMGKNEPILFQSKTILLNIHFWSSQEMSFLKIVTFHLSSAIEELTF